MGNPVTYTPTSMLCQDYVSSDNAMVDPIPGQVAPFCNNAYKGGLPEAGVVVDIAPGGSQIAVLVQEPTQTGGWALIVPGTDLAPGAAGAPVYPAVEVVTAVNYGGVNLIYNSGTDLMQTYVYGVDLWTEPAPIAANTVVTNLSVTYALAGQVPATEPLQPVVYGLVGSQLFMLTNTEGFGWQSFTVTIDGAILNEQTPIALTCFQQPDGSGSFDWVLMAPSSQDSGAIAYWTGTVDVSTNTASPASGATNYRQTRTPFGQLFGSVSLSGQPSPNAFPLYLDTNHMPFLSSPFTNYWDQVLPAPSSDVSSAWTTMDANGMLSVFLLDTTNETVALMHQVGTENSGNLPLWAPYIPVAADAVFVYPDTVPTDPLVCFIAQSSSGGDLFLTQLVDNEAPLRPRWTAAACTTGTTEQYEVSRYLTQITLYDDTGAPVPNYPLDVSANAAVGVQVGAQSFVIGPNTPNGIIYASPGSTPIATCASGVLTLATVATDLAPPTFTITDPTGVLPDVIVISPGQPAQNYLNSQPASLPPTSTAGPAQFTGSTMSSASVTPAGGTPTQVFPGASPTPSDNDTTVSNVNQVIQMPASPGAQEGALPQSGGFIIHNLHPSGPVVQAFATAADMHAELLLQGRYVNFGLFSDIGHAFSDVWSGITTDAAKVAHVAVDFEKKVVSIAIQVGEVLEEIGNIIVETIEDALNVVLAILSALDTLFKILLLFLKALFDFKAIWNTMTVFYSTISDGTLTSYLDGLLDKASDYIGQTLTNYETQVNQFFGTLEGKLTGTLGDSAASVGQTVGSPPSTQPPLASNPPSGAPLSASDVTANPQGNWLQAQVSAAGGSMSVPTYPTGGAVETNWQALLTELETGAFSAMQDFGEALQALWQSLLDFIGGNDGDAAQLADMALADLLAFINQVVDELLVLADLILQELINLARAAVAGLDDVLTTPLDLGFIGDLYTWIGEVLADSGGQPPLTYGTFVSLMVAFPYTIAYWFIYGASGEPFPNGVLPSPGAGAPPGAALGADPVAEASSASDACELAGSIGQMLYVVVDTVADLLGNNAPEWLTAVEIAGPALITTFGWPSESGIPFTPVFSGSTAADLEVASWAFGYAVPVLDLIIYGISKTEDDPAEQENLNSVSKVIASFFGAANVIFAIAATATAIAEGEGEDENLEDVIASILTPLSNAFSFLTASKVIEEESLEAALAVKLIIDFLANLVGGAIELVGVVAPVDA